MYLHLLYCIYILITIVATLYTYLNAVKIAATVLVSSFLSCTTICQSQERDRYGVHVLLTYVESLVWFSPPAVQLSLINVDGRSLFDEIVVESSNTEVFGITVIVVLDQLLMEDAIGFQVCRT